MAPSWPLIQLGVDAPLDEVLKLCTPNIVDDLLRLSQLFADTQGSLLEVKPLVLNPTFTQSTPLGGADADLILDGLLLDIKTWKHALPRRSELWQLIGYALADTEDQHRINRVGFYFARHGSRVEWPLDDLLRRLAGKEVDLAETRKDFATLLEKVGRRPVRLKGTNARIAHIAPVKRVGRALPFHPPLNGKGRWHIAYADAKTDASDCDAPERTASCGSGTILNLDARPKVPRVGQPRTKADSRFCRRCLLFTESFFEWWDKLKADERQSLTFREPAKARGRWHIARADVFPSREHDPTLSDCGQGRTIQPDGQTFTADITSLADDPRLCLHCIKGIRYRHSQGLT